MPFSSYTGRPWRVSEAAPDSKCKPGTSIRFSGTPDKVIIQCDGETPYLEGVYIELSNTIVRAKDYVIMMSPPIIPIPPAPPFNFISFTSKGSDSSGGSWTADDSTPPEPGD